MFVIGCILALLCASAAFAEWNSAAQGENPVEEMVERSPGLTQNLRDGDVDPDDYYWPRVVQVENWPSLDKLTGELGQVAGVAVDTDGNPVILHRGKTVWDGSSFNGSNIYQGIANGPIPVDVLVKLDKDTGDVIKSWGKDMFYMPHGLNIDSEGNYWITDVAMHQVFKFPSDSTTPSLVMGNLFRPGKDERSYCQPSDVAVARNGDFFVSDGYCNSRIIKYAANGDYITEWGQSRSGRKMYAVAHSLYLDEVHDEICLADRENARVLCYTAGLRSQPGKFQLRVENSGMGRVFAITGTGPFLFAVTGPTPGLRARGYTIDASTADILDTWNSKQRFQNPHDATVSQDGTALYVVEILPNRITKFLLDWSNIPQ